jgi:hypothetical protein
MIAVARWVAVSALLACPIAANAQAVTYDFTGTIITGPAANGYAGGPTGGYAADTGSVAGTFTFDFANANPAQSSGTVATAPAWGVENWTGTNQTGPQSVPGNVFATTLVGTSAGDAGLSYSTASPPSSYWSVSGVQSNVTPNYTGAPQYTA